MPSVSVGVCAHNEEKNILQSLSSISSQSLDGFELLEVIVVSSGSTDRTDSIVEECAQKDRRVRLIVQERREGKCVAVNLFMKEAEGDVLVLVNADNRLTEGALSKLLEPFREEKVGMVGGHPVPVNPTDTLVGSAVRTLWDMHHRLSLVTPKTGELIAFRNLRIILPDGINTDEDWIRMEMERRGYRVAYAPAAIVLNKGPETLREFMMQRTRVNIGERYMKRRYGFTVPTWNSASLMPTVASLLRDSRGQLWETLVAMTLEASARIYANLYVALNKPDPHIWSVAETTKDLD
jgi:glycosyltransferase involved in cell wall biosynthesis